MSKCKLCGDKTDVIVNINFKKTYVCDPCCNTITLQTVQYFVKTQTKSNGK